MAARSSGGYHQPDSDVTSLAKDTQLLLQEVKAEQVRSKGMMAKLEEALVRFK